MVQVKETAFSGDPLISKPSIGKTPEANPSNPIRLERKLGLFSAISMIVGVIVGSGIFVSPKGVLERSGSIGAATLVWSVCGLLSLMGALCLAELGTFIPASGGDYTYINLAYGPLVSFLYLWATVFIILPSSNAIAALTFANYILQPFFHDCEPPGHAIRLVAFALILLLVYVNCRSVELSIKLQDSFTVTKVIALILIIAYGAYNIVRGKDDKLIQQNWWHNSTTSLSVLAGAFYSGFYSYAGWNSLNFVTEELKDPIKNMPRAIIISITTITVIYIFANLAYFSVLGVEGILSSTAIADTFSKKIGMISWIIPILVALSTTSGLNALIYSSSRILFVGARQGQLFSLLNIINIYNLTPVPSLMFVGFVSILYLSLTNIFALINYLTFAEAGFGTLAVSTVLVFRYKFPEKARPMRVSTFIPLVYLPVATVMIVAPILDDPTGAVIGMGIVLLGIPVYYATANWKDKPICYQNKIDSLNIFVQKLTMSIQPVDDTEYKP